jgi:polar amino acid transport system substrate-binding protein
MTPRFEPLRHCRRSWSGLSLAVLMLLAIGSFSGECRAQTSGPSHPSMPDRELVIGIKEAPPFVINVPDGGWRGISIDLWRRIAEQLHLRYRFSEQATIEGLIDGTKGGSFDAAVAALTVTAARQRVLDFTQPFYTTGLGIAVSTREESRWFPILRVFLSFGFLQAIAVLVGIALSVGFLVWLFERRRNEHYSGGAKGLGASFWWSAIAMTQAGAAQNAPMTLPGRVLAIGWMIASVVTIAVFTAGITSALTKRELQGIVHGVNDLRSVRVGAVSGSATVDYLTRERIAHRGFADPQEGLRMLQAGGIDAFVYDKPLLTWIVRHDFSASARVLDVTFDTQNYGIALPLGSPLRQAVNLAVLDAVESEWWQQTVFQYLGRR